MGINFGFQSECGISLRSKMVGKHLDYRLEVARIYSFRNWKLKFLDPLDLANAGFYYTGHGDYTKCFSCNVTLSGWQPGDRPWEEHYRVQKNCK